MFVPAQQYKHHVRSIARSGVCRQRRPPLMPSRTDSSNLQRELEVKRAVMGQRCRPQSFGEVQRCNPLCLLLTAAQYSCCSCASLTDQLVRILNDSLGINTTMKKFFFFVPVQTMKKIFLFLPVQQYKRHVRSIARSGVSPCGARSDGHHGCQAARTAATCT